MILKPAFLRPEVIAALRPLGPLIPGAIDPEQAAALRSQASWKPFALAHRGRYAFADLPRSPELHRFAEAHSGLPLSPDARPRLLRFRRGDYSLKYDDARTRTERGVELTLDLSARATFEGEIVYEGDSELVIPQRPGLLAVVLRTPGTFRYERYLTHALGRAVIHRLRVNYPLR
jgi:hypothetical protein